MSFSADAYMAAAQERLADAERLYALRRYALSHYAAGLAVECLLRGYRYRIDPEFDSRHSLSLLFDSCGLNRVMSSSGLFRMRVLLSEIIRRWSNDLRFLSGRELRQRLKRARLDRGVKGDFVKESSRRILGDARGFLALGMDQWQLFPKK
jgi:HEPN domain-containing protein